MNQAMDNNLQKNKNKGNIILNHDFSRELLPWRANCCDAYVAHEKASHLAVVTNRTETWQGLEQDITERVSVNCSYFVSASVRVRGCIEGRLNYVQATLRLEKDSGTDYSFVGRIEASEEKWKQLEGEFVLNTQPERVVLYLEGPPPGVDLLIDSVSVYPSANRQFEIGLALRGEENIVKDSNIESDLNNLSMEVKSASSNITAESITINPYFGDGLKNWSARGCKLSLSESTLPYKGKTVFACTSERHHTWNGIEQEITQRVQRKLAYEVNCIVRILGKVEEADVQVTLWVQSPNSREEYICIDKVKASEKEWAHLCGKFLINGWPSKVVIFLEGPPPGSDILVASFKVKHAKKLIPFETSKRTSLRSTSPGNIILNPEFSDEMSLWHPNGCRGRVISSSNARTGKNVAFISDRTEPWQGLEQDITDRITINCFYIVSAWIRVSGGHHEECEVLATIKLENSDSNVTYKLAGKVMASRKRWVELKGSFSLLNLPKRVVFLLEGPSSGVDLLVDSVSIASSQHLQRQKRVLFGENIIKNSSLEEELTGWHSMGSCTLKVCSGSPVSLPHLAKESLGQNHMLSGRYILATSRSQSWMGPAHTITDRVAPTLTYQISAWVRVGPGPGGPHKINLAFSVGGCQWVNGGQIEVNDSQWHDIAGSFRLEKMAEVIVYVQGPSPGIDLMVAGLLIFPVDRVSRFELLKRQTDKVRKRDIVLRIHGGNWNLPVKVQQTHNSFPFGSCLNRSILDNEDFVNFFLKNFNWAVFANELKWAHTEPKRGVHNYSDADEMLAFCERHVIPVRAHCLFWEVEETLPNWVCSLNQSNLDRAIRARVESLLTRYRGRFCHLDVNNEMLHGSFFRERLGGPSIWAHMFQLAQKADPALQLFVNDYNVEDGKDPTSAPESYTRHIIELQEAGAAVGGIGIQAHIDSPIGPIIAAALDRLAVLGLPIWLTELDVSAADVHVRAEDLEVVLREAYAHPAIGGIMLWGFWETATWRQNSHLVDAEGEVNAAGERLLALRREWMTETKGIADDAGEFRFRGFHGNYKVEVAGTSHTIAVGHGDSPLIVDLYV